MKKRTLISAIFVTILCSLNYSCKQSDNNNVPVAQFAVKGIQDISMAVYDTRALQLEVKPAISITDTAKMAVTGLPAHVTSVFSTKGTIAPFTTELTITAEHGAKPGYYPLKVTVTTPSGITAFPFYLTITEAPDCSSAFTGTLAAVDSTYLGVTASTVTIAKTPGYGNRLAISNFAGSGLTVYADLTCGNGVAVIPEQTMGTKTTVGAGAFTLNPRKLILNYSVSSQASPTLYCRTVIQ